MRSNTGKARRRDRRAAKDRRRIRRRQRPQGLSEQEGIARLDASSDEFVHERGLQMSEMRSVCKAIQRERRNGAGWPWGRLVALARDFDPLIARRAYASYEPAVPVTSEGFILGGVGLLSGFALFQALAAPFRMAAGAFLARRSSLRPQLSATGPNQIMIPNILSIAGSDPSGGAGVQADLKTFAAIGCYGLAAITALTVQSTKGVSGVLLPPAGFVGAEIDAIFEDIEVAAVKIGMLGSAENVEAVAARLAAHKPPAIISIPSSLRPAATRWRIQASNRRSSRSCFRWRR